MTLLDRLARGVERRATLAEPPDWMWDAFGGLSTYTGKRVNVDLALTSVPVYAAVKIIAESIGILPLIVHKTSPDGTKQEARNNRWWSILHDAPNREQPAGEVWETVVAHMALWGNAYLYKERDDLGRVSALWPIRPSRVRVGRIDGRRIYEIVQSSPGVDINPLGSLVGDETDILHIRNLGTDGLVGLSPIAEARQMLSTQLAADEYQARFYANNATPSGVLEVPGTLTKEAAERLQAQWESRHGGLQNAAKTAVLEGGTAWKQVGMPLQDQEFIAQQEFGITQVARLFRIPPYMLNAGTGGRSLTYTTTEMEGIHFTTYTLMRWTTRIEQALVADADVATMGAIPGFSFDSLLRSDSTSRAQFYTAALSPVTGWMTRPEVRERENLPPQEDQVTGDPVAEDPQQITGPGLGDQSPPVLPVSPVNGDRPSLVEPTPGGA